MKLSAICEHTAVSGDVMLKLLGRMSPDTLVDVRGSHSFLFSAASGLLVDPTPNSSHSEWFDAEDDVFSIYDEPDRICGRLNADYHGTPVAAIWPNPKGDSRSLARALLGVLGDDAMASVFSRKAGVGNDVMPLRGMAGLGSGKQARGHRYWQTRQTSEGRIRRDPE